MDPGDVAARVDAAILDVTDPGWLGELLLARAILRQGYNGFDESAQDCREAFRQLRQTDRNGTAALAAIRRVLLGNVAFRQGRLEEAREHLDTGGDQGRAGNRSARRLWR